MRLLRTTEHHLGWSLTLAASIWMAGCSSSSSYELPLETPQFARCSAETPCPGALQCVSGVCLAPDRRSAATNQSCDVASPCPPGFICQGDRCMAPMSQCESDFDCPYDQRCSINQCVENTTPRRACRTEPCR